MTPSRRAHDTLTEPVRKNMSGKGRERKGRERKGREGSAVGFQDQRLLSLGTARVIGLGATTC